MKKTWSCAICLALVVAVAVVPSAMGSEETESSTRMRPRTAEAAGRALPRAAAQSAAPECFFGTPDILGTAAADTLSGTDAVDVIHGLGGNDVIHGLEGDDIICGGDGDDQIFGEAGNDNLFGDMGNDLVDGGEGTSDYASHDFSPVPVTVDLAAGTARGEGFDELEGIEGVAGSAFNDTLTGNGDDNQFYGLLGDDRMDGLAGSDTVHYDDAATGVEVDLSQGVATGVGSDTLDGIERVQGSEYDDNIIGDEVNNDFFPGAGADQVDGGDGNDLVSFLSSPAAVRVDLETGRARGFGADQLTSIESIRGSKKGDVLLGDGLVNSIWGNAGNDVIDGRGGFDWALFHDALRGVRANLTAGTATGEGSDVLRRIEGLSGSPFNDTFTGNSKSNSFEGYEGDDRMVGQGGFDFVTYFWSYTPVVVSLESGEVTGQGSDTLARIEGVTGSQFDDILVGDAGNNSFYPEGGDDSVTGGGGFDWVSFFEAEERIVANLALGTALGDGSDTLEEVEGLMGSPHDDLFVGNESNNWFYGDGGDDRMEGGEGVDVLMWYDVGPIVGDLSTGSVTGEGTDSFTGVEGFSGSLYDDDFTGTDSNDFLDGYLGNDTLRGLGGDDYLVPGPGNDTIDGGAGDWDSVEFFVSTPIIASLVTGTATGEGNDTFTNVEGLGTGDGPDTITGDDGPNYLFGWGGADVIRGGDGVDLIDGGTGEDRVDAQGGDDSCLAAERVSACEHNVPAEEAPEHPLFEVRKEASEVKSGRRNH